MDDTDDLCSLSERTLFTITADGCSISDETLINCVVQNGCELDEVGDVMVEVVGSEVIVNGVSSEGGSWNWVDDGGSMEKDMEDFLESKNMIEHDAEEGESEINLRNENGISNNSKHNPVDPSSVEEILSLLHLVAVEPKNGESISSLSSISTFFSNFRNSVSVHFPGRRKSRCSGKKRKMCKENGSPEEFVYDEAVESFSGERTVENGSEEPLAAADKCTINDNGRRAENGPAELVLNFCEGNSVPVESSLNKMFKRFGPLQELETEVDRERWRARVVFKRCMDAEVAMSSAGTFNIFGPMMVNYQLNYTPSIPFALFQGQDDPILLTSSGCS